MSDMAASATHPAFPGYVFNRDGTMLRKDGVQTAGCLQDGYYVFMLKNADGNWQRQRANRLILETFSGEAPGDREVDHINGISTDNRVENLRFMTRLEHRQHTYSCNVGHTARSASKRGKAVIAIDENGEIMHFDTISSAALFCELTPRESGVICKALKKGGTVRGLQFKYVSQDIDGEEWRKVEHVPGLKGNVHVSNFGRVKTDRVVTLGNIGGGYYKMSLTINDKPKVQMVHALVCGAFHGAKPDWASSVNHKDRNTLNNRPSNLEWSDPVAQGAHKRATVRPAQIGALPLPARKGAEEDVEDDIEMDDNMVVDDVVDVVDDMDNMNDVDYNNLEDNVNVSTNVPTSSIILADPEYTLLRDKFLKVIEDTEFPQTETENVSGANKTYEVEGFKYKYSLEWYESQVFTANTYADVEALDVEVEFVDDHVKAHLWNFFRAHTSSFAGSKNPGRFKSFLVKDKTSGKYLGIFSLGSDGYACKPRDDYIGWSFDYRRIRSICIMNIRTCVGLQPVSHNFNVGKLIASLCFSKEVIDRMEETYGNPIAALTTFGINGKSVQYERLKCLKYIGLTKGNGTDHIPQELYVETCALLKRYNITFDHVRLNKLGKLTLIASIFNIPFSKLIHHGKQRGIYIGFTGAKADAEAFLQGKTATFKHTSASVADITKEWKTRWAKQRYEHLTATDRLKDVNKVEWTTQPKADKMKDAAAPKKERTQRTDIYKAAEPTETVVYARPSAQGVEKSIDHKFALSKVHTEKSRERSGLTDATIDEVRRRVDLGEKNVDIEKALKLTRKQVSSIKNRLLIKASEIADPEIAKAFLEEKRKRIAGENDPALSASQKRRAISAETIVAIVNYAHEHPIGYTRLMKDAPERFGVTITVNVCKGLLTGKTRLAKQEFPIGDLTFERYTEMIEVIAARDYSTLRA